MSFQDHFSAGSEGYARFRPRYPDALYAWLAATAPTRRHAVDVATGTGQAATGLAGHFRRVSAFDASAGQVRQAEGAPGLTYGVARAEELPLADGAADLVTVAQALHWLDLDRFYPEARRVLVPGGLLAVWTYNRLQVDPAVDALVEHLYSDILRGDWPAGRVHVESGYRDLPFPFARIAVPPFAMQADWLVDDLLGYLGTWSALRRYTERTGRNPLPQLEADLRRAFGDRRRRVEWPLVVLAGRA